MKCIQVQEDTFTRSNKSENPSRHRPLWVWSILGTVKITYNGAVHPNAVEPRNHFPSCLESFQKVNSLVASPLSGYGGGLSSLVKANGGDLKEKGGQAPLLCLPGNLEMPSHMDWLETLPACVILLLSFFSENDNQLSSMIKIQAHLEAEGWTVWPLKIFLQPYISGESMAEGMWYNKECICFVLGSCHSVSKSLEFLSDSSSFCYS